MSTSWNYIKSDLYRYEGKVTLYLFLRNFFFNPGFKFTCFLRLCQFGSTPVRKVARFFHFYFGIKYGLKIYPSTKVGYGFYIAHGQSVVIHPSTIIGNNVSVSQFSSIGTTRGVAATIGDNVYIGPNVSIVEDVKIGDAVTIGASAVVTKSLPNNSTAVGNPAKVINFNSNGKLNTFKWSV